MAIDEEVEVVLGPIKLSGQLTIPEEPGGVVLFAHGSGSSRHSPRNRLVAGVLNDAALGTLLFDLLTPIEETDRNNVFDIPMLGERLTRVTEWLRAQPEGKGLPIGYFGASTGAGAALVAAADPDAQIAAVVSRGGRPDLAEQSLPLVTAPTLLVVGSLDRQVIQLNQEAQRQLLCENRLEIVPGATHLFEEAGTLEEVAALACRWFVSHFGVEQHPPS